MRIGVVGGGASGMTAAIFAAISGAQVLVLEHTGRVGKKILSTGNGKCNFTNKKLSKDDYNGNHPSFAEPVIAKFSQEAAIDFFESCGLYTISKRDGYLYPYSGQASAVLNILRYKMESLGVLVETDVHITQVKKEKSGKFTVWTAQDKFCFDKLILACGGNAAPNTGSDGSGYNLAQMLGHSIVKPLPVLTYLKSRDVALKELAGVRHNAELSLYVEGACIQKESGELQLNKDNLSGIPVFQLSHKAIRALDRKKTVAVHVDFLPDMNIAQLKNRLENLVNLYGDFLVSDVLCGLVHKKVVGALMHREGISFDKKMRALSGMEQTKLVSRMKDWDFEITAYPGFEAAQATQGGVDVLEIDENMMSRKVEGLYFAGEMVDIDGRCGGYNLQWAWSSGYVAGCHCVNGDVTCYESVSVK